MPAKTKWKEIKVNFSIECPTLGHVRSAAKAVVDSGYSEKLSFQHHNTLCILANLILNEDTINHPIFPKRKLKKIK